MGEDIPKKATLSVVKANKTFNPTLESIFSVVKKPESDSTFIRKRRSPRRQFCRKVGMLIMGTYNVGDGWEISEGGMLISSNLLFSVGQKTVLSFQIPGSVFMVLRGTVRYLIKPSANVKFPKYGVSFDDIDFAARRFIRNYVAQKTEGESTLLSPTQADHLDKV